MTRNEDEDVVMDADSSTHDNDDEQQQHPSFQLSAMVTEPSSRIRTSDSLRKQPQQQDASSNDEQPHFAPLTAQQASNKGGSEYRRVRCPPHRYTPLREHWEQILTPLVEYLKLQVRVCNNF